jgi:o-succinylbenzoate synthase
VRPLRLRFARPVVTARGVFTGRSIVLLELRDQDGYAGYGEAAPWPGFGTETVEEAGALLDAAAALLCDRELQPGHWTPELAVLLQHAPTARAAVQGALWDLAARRAGTPLAVQLAACAGSNPGGVLRHVAVSALLVAFEPDALREEAARAAAAGHRAVKLKLGVVPLAADVARVRAVREGLGDRVRLRGDANGAWSATQALEALQALAEFDLDYVEQPLHCDDIDGLAALRRHAPVRIAADESVATEQGALRLLERTAADVVVLKPATLGGPARALELAAQARRSGVEVVFTHTFESAIGARHALHCAAAWADPAGIHGLVTAGLFESDVAPPVDCHAGFADIPAAAGIGMVP